MMLLQRLREYSERLMLPPPLYSEAPVRYIVELDGDGNLLNPSPTDTADPESRASKRGARRLVPQIQRSSGIQPLLFADNSEYTFGLPRPRSESETEEKWRRRQERVCALHRAYVELVEKCRESTGEPRAKAVHRFLTEGTVRKLQLPEDFDISAFVTFRVDWEFVVDISAVQAFWAAEHSPEGGSAPVMQCLVCGERRPVLGRLQGKLKRVPGGQTSGTALISANAEAFESYGLEASLIAPTCGECGERFTKAANHLLSDFDRSSRVDVGGAAFLFWTKDANAGFPIRTLLTDPQPEDVRHLIESAFTGRKTEVDDTAFYATSLSGSGGRAVVRDWIDTTLWEAKQNLARWFSLQELVNPYGEKGVPMSVYRLANATVRDAKDLPVTTPRAMVRAAIEGTPPPRGLLYQAVRRNRAEQKVTYSRAALIKLVLASLGDRDKEDRMVQLDEGRTDAAYRCGRLLAVLEQVQKVAVPGVKASIVDRFFGTASSAPASVFGRLIRGSQPHLAKLERDRRGAHIALQRRLEQVLSGLANFPRTLTLEEQGLFALGYYHQRAFDRQQAKQAKERSVRGEKTEGLEDLLEDEDHPE